jgi:hypothetical protein
MNNSGKAAQRKALVVGISDYTSLQQLDFCKNDGTEVYDVLSSLRYDISRKNKLVGEVKGETLRDAIYDFFDDRRNSLDDTLVFYYSGHGVPDVDGEMYLASSDTDPDKPYRRGFSFEDLRKRMENTIATRVVVILDCCYSGSAKISKGNEEDSAKRGRLIIEQKSRKLPEGQGKYILSSSQSHQEAYALTTGEHSIFTYYLLEGLRGSRESIDSEGNVTPQSLGNYIIRAIMSLPPDERPRQRPLIKAEESGNVVLASYPKLIPPPTTPVPINSSYESPTKTHEAAVHRGILRSKTKISIALIATVIGIVIALALFNHYNYHTPSTTATPSSNTLTLKPINASSKTPEVNYYKNSTANKTPTNASYHTRTLAHKQYHTRTLPHKQYHTRTLPIDHRYIYALYNKARAFYGLGNYTEALIYVDKALVLDPKYYDALTGKGFVLNALGNHTGAITYFDKALAIDSIYKYALNGKGWALISLGNNTGAITYFDKALAIDPKYEDALLGLAQANRLHQLTQPAHNNATLRDDGSSRRNGSMLLVRLDLQIKYIFLVLVIF